MISVLSHGYEPDPHNGDDPRCAYCDCAEVAEVGDYCSEECMEQALAEFEADARLSLERDKN